MNNYSTETMTTTKSVDLADLIANYFNYYITPAFRGYAELILWIFGLFGNTLCLIVYIAYAKEWHPNARTYYIALAIMDIIYIFTFGTVDWLGNGLYYISGNTMGYALDGASDIGCKVVRYLGASAEGGAQYVLVVYGLERLLAVYYPLRVSRLFPPKVAKMAATAAILSSFAVHGGMPRDFALQYDPTAAVSNYQSCSAVTNPQLQFKIRALYDYAIPLSFDVILNSILIVKLASVALKRRKLLHVTEDKSVLSSSKETSATVTLVFLCVVHAIILIPVSIAFMVFSFQKTQTSNLLSLAMVRFTLCTVNILHAVNFCIYLKQSAKFREKVRCILLCKFL